MYQASNLLDRFLKSDMHVHVEGQTQKQKLIFEIISGNQTWDTSQDQVQTAKHQLF